MGKLKYCRNCEKYVTVVGDPLSNTLIAITITVIILTTGIWFGPIQSYQWPFSLIFNDYDRFAIPIIIGTLVVWWWILFTNWRCPICNCSDYLEDDQATRS